jgi:hypothetical protein
MKSSLLLPRGYLNSSCLYFPLHSSPLLLSSLGYNNHIDLVDRASLVSEAANQKL